MATEIKHKCSKCEKVKSKKDFHTDKKHSSGVQRYCKVCTKKVDRKGKYGDKYCVYYLPKHSYVGMTIHFTKRMQKHEQRGRNTKGAFVLFKTKNAKIAHTVEHLLHMMGFNGFRY